MLIMIMLVMVVVGFCGGVYGDDVDGVVVMTVVMIRMMVVMMTMFMLPFLQVWRQPLSHAWCVW